MKNSGGVGFFGLLTIAFSVLRLCEVIMWSWWLVLSPLLAVFSIIIFDRIPTLREVVMPNRDGKGPKGGGKRDGSGRGKGNGTGKGAGKGKGGKKGGCK